MSINTILTKYRDSNPPFNEDSQLIDPKELQSSLEKIPEMQLNYEKVIRNGSIRRRDAANIDSLKKNVTFGSSCLDQSVIASLLDPPLKPIKITDSLSHLKALYLDNRDGPDMNKVLDRSDFFHSRDIWMSSKDLLAKGSSIVGAHKVMEYALSQTDEAVIPQTTKAIAREVLSGGVDPFNNVRKIRHLGKGNYGIVDLVKTKDGHQYAAKTFQGIYGDFNSEDFNHEYQHLASVNGNHIVRLIHASPPTLFLEFAENGPLTTDLEQEKVLKALSQIAVTLSNMHENQKIIHGDLKFDNILLDKKDDIKIADLGLAFFKYEFPKYIEKMRSSQYIPYYLPPELKGGILNPEDCEKIDVWSFGILIWNFLKKDNCYSPIKSPIWVEPFKGFKEADLIDQLNPEKITSIDPEGTLITFMERCLQANPSDRPNMREISHYFLRVAASPNRDSAINSAPLPSVPPSPALRMFSINPIGEDI